jgi:hypothetical protein
LVEDEQEIARRIERWGLAQPKGKGSKRPSSKDRATDPDGNNYNITATGYAIR